MVVREVDTDAQGSPSAVIFNSLLLETKGVFFVQQKDKECEILRVICVIFKLLSD